MCSKFRFLSKLIGVAKPQSKKRPVDEDTNQNVTTTQQHQPAPKKQKIRSDLEPQIDSDEEKNKPLCKYGLGCYRTNPEHRKQYRHGAGNERNINEMKNSNMNKQIKQT